MARIDNTGKAESGPPRKKSKLDELMEQFEKLSPEERKRDIERANKILRENGGRLP
jgi:hypothetical protein